MDASSPCITIRSTIQDEAEYIRKLDYTIGRLLRLGIVCKCNQWTKLNEDAEKDMKTK